MDFPPSLSRHRPSYRSILSIIIAVALISTLMPNFEASGAESKLSDEEYEETFPLFQPTKGINISLSGVEKISDAANTFVWGEEWYPQGGHLGHWVWTGDVNGDNLTDMAMAAPGATGTTGFPQEGKVYIFYGKEGQLPEEIDLTLAEPDITIIGSADPNLSLDDPRRGATADLTNEMSAGDYNGDGFRDLAVAFPYSSFGSFVYLIWGNETGLPSYIELNISMYATTPPPHIRLGGMGLAPGGDDLKLPNYMMTRDLDGDGSDDLISGGYVGGNAMPLQGVVTILWGGSGGTTQLIDPQEASYFGYGIDIGDIDGDGRYDMIVGAPWCDRTDLGLDDTGSVMVYFNVSKFKGMGSVNAIENARPVINGSGHHDNLGKNVELHDVDGDGYDDIIGVAPMGDGINNFKRDCGQVFLFKGGPELSYPKYMDAESDFHTVVIGHEGHQSGATGTSGDMTGEIMELGDIDGDDVHEVMIGISNKNQEADETGIRNKAGAVLLYELSDLFPPLGGIVQIDYPASKFTIEGNEIEDSMGFDLEVGDIDNDGIEDILIGAPGGDGPENMRPRSGEVYIVRGLGLRVESVSATGPGADRDILFGGGHQIYLNISYRNTMGADLISNSTLILDPEGMGIGVKITGEDASILEDPHSLLSVQDVIWGNRNERGWINLSMSLSWYFPRRDIDVRVDMNYDGSVASSRTFIDLFTTSNSIMLKGDPNILVEEKPILTLGEWHRPGDDLEIFGIDLVYKRKPSLLIPPGEFELVLFKEGTEVDSSVFGGQGDYDPLSLGTVLEGNRMCNLTIIPILMEGPPPAGLPPSSEPTTGTPFTYICNLDSRKPQPPSDVGIISHGGSVEGFISEEGSVISWQGSPGVVLDNHGSGIREYQVSINDGPWAPAWESGGLFATYYTDQNSYEVGLERTDEMVSFMDWGPWSPDPGLIPPDHFSARWHGFFIPDYTGENALRLRGRGEAMMVLDGNVAVEWQDIYYGVDTPFFQAEEGSVHSMEIYYKHETGPAGIVLEYLDDQGGFSEVKETLLAYPCNCTDLPSIGAGQGDEIIDSRVRALDWTGRSSDAGSASALMDTSPPMIDLTGIDAWIDTTETDISIPVEDTGSGLNITSVEMRMREETGQWSDWTPYWGADVSPEELVPGMDSATFKFRLFLNRKWTGYLQFRACDLLANSNTTNMISLGVDTDAPEWELLSPVPGEKLRTGNITFKWGAHEERGSGVDRSTGIMRYKLDNGDWSDWLDPIHSVINGPSEGVEMEFDLNVQMPSNLKVQFMVADVVGNSVGSDVFSFNVTKPPLDHPPVPKINRPENGTVIIEGQLLTLDATGTRDDGLGGYDDVRLTWFSSIEGYIGSGNALSVRLEKGIHEITLYADDGTRGHNISASVFIEVIPQNTSGSVPGGDEEVEENEGGNDLILLLGAVLILAVLIAAVAFVVFKFRKVRFDHVELGFTERTEDDEDYDEKT